MTDRFFLLQVRSANTNRWTMSTYGVICAESEQAALRKVAGRLSPHYNYRIIELICASTFELSYVKPEIHHGWSIEREIEVEERPE